MKRYPRYAMIDLDAPVVARKSAVIAVILALIAGIFLGQFISYYQRRCSKEIPQVCLQYCDNCHYKD